MVLAYTFPTPCQEAEAEEGAKGGQAEEEEYGEATSTGYPSGGPASE